MPFSKVTSPSGLLQVRRMVIVMSRICSQLSVARARVLRSNTRLQGS